MDAQIMPQGGSRFEVSSYLLPIVLLCLAPPPAFCVVPTLAANSRKSVLSTCAITGIGRNTAETPVPVSNPTAIASTEFCVRYAGSVVC